MLLLLGVHFHTLAQSIYVLKYPGKENYKVYVTHHKYEADIVVYITKKDMYSSKLGYWYFSKYNCNDCIKIFYVKYKSDANLIVYFTNKEYESGARKH